MYHPLNAVAVPGRVGMEECSLGLNYFNQGQAIDFLVGRGAAFPIA